MSTLNGPLVKQILTIAHIGIMEKKMDTTIQSLGLGI